MNRHLAAPTVGLFTLTLASVGLTTNATAADTASSAYGISASGTAKISTQPSVTSEGPTKSTSVGTVRSTDGAVTATGISLTAGTGTAKATVASVKFGTITLSDLVAQCHDGTTGVTVAGVTKAPDSTQKLSDTVTATYNIGHGGTVIAARLVLAGGGQTITIASATCGKSNPPATDPKPTGTPDPDPHPTKPNKTTTPPHKPTKPAPTQQPVPGHLPVTG